MGLHVHRFGPEGGPPLLCIHGVTGHGRRFRRLAEEGFPQRRVVAVDLRGHGRSPYEPPWTVEQHVRDVVAVLDAEGLERTPVLGHSFGGLITTHLLAAAPERVERAVLIDPAIALDPAYALGEAEAIRMPASWASLDEAREARREGRPPQAFAGSDEDVAEHAVQGADGRYRFRICPSAAVTAWSEMSRPQVALGGCTVPLLLIGAAQAPYVTDATRAWLAADLGDAFREVTIDAGHMLYWDAFDETVAHTRRFLQS
jgi:lipase